MTPANRARLVRAVVDQVVVDESAGNVTLTLADLRARLSAVNEATETADGTQRGSAS